MRLVLCLDLFLPLSLLIFFPCFNTLSHVTTTLLQSVFGGIEFYYRQVYKVHARSMTFSDIYVLSREDFDHLLLLYPDRAEVIDKNAVNLKEKGSYEKIAGNLKNKKVTRMFEAETQAKNDGPLVFPPNSAFRRGWELFIFFVIWYNAICVPLRIAFMMDSSAYQFASYG